MRILYVHSTLVPPPTDLDADRFYLLSEHLEGDVLQPVWFRTPEEVESVFGPGSYPVYSAGRFRYHWFLSRHDGVRLRLATFWFYLRKGWSLWRSYRHDCIVAYSHMTPGLCAAFLKLLTGSKLIIEVATSPHLAYLTERPVPTWGERIMHLYSDACLHVSILMADRAHLLYPQQLSSYPLLRNVKSSVFHEFVPTAKIERNPQEPADVYVLLVGAPWYLKGADLLVEAFLRLAPDFPHVKLKLLGHFPDADELHQLIGDAPQIEVLKARPNPEALRIISQAAILVLPSRSEGMGRVLIEGMAAGVPLIGSDVGGIPFMIRDGENGLLFPGGNSHALEARLRELLSNPDRRARMGCKGYKKAHSELNERVYVERFTKMVQAAVNGG